VYPFSRGHIHITGPNREDPLDFEHGFFTDACDIDLKKHIWSYKKQREVIRRMPSYRGEMAQCHPPFAPESKAAIVELSGPLPADVPDIEYSADDDVVLEKWLRSNVGTTWHALGTCKMLPRNQNGVVDANLSVYGVEGLKIADLSIVPRNVAANTNNTALAVGEKAGDIFIKELGLVSA
jgi:alcohol oxidase